MVWRTIKSISLFVMSIGLAGCLAAKDYTIGAASSYSEKDYKASMEYARKAIELDPSYPYAWYWLGMASIEQANWDEAISAFKKRIEFGPADSLNQYNGSYLWLAIGHFRKGQQEEALAAARRAVALDPRSDAAQQALKKIEQKQKDISADTTINTIGQATKSGNFTWAVSELKRLRKTMELAPAYRLGRAGDLLLRFCDPDGAILFYEEALKESPSEKETRELRQALGFSYSQKKDPARTRQYLGGLGFIGVRVNTRDEGIIIADTTPNLPGAQAGLQSGDVILMAGGITVKDQSQFLSLIRQSEPGSRLILQVRRQGQRLEKTVTVGTILDSSFSDPIACRAQQLNRQGVALVKEGKKPEALAKFQEALQAAPGPFAKAHYNAALVLEQSGKVKEAMGHFIQAHQSFLRIEDEIEALRRLLELTKKARIAVPETADRRYRIGIVRAQQKRYQEAGMEFEAAIAEAPWLLEAYYNLALVSDSNHQYPQALQALRIYAGLAPHAPNIGAVKTKIVELEDKIEPLEKKKTRGWLGVFIQDLTPELAGSLGLKDTKGAYVSGLMKGGPAERAGLKIGDVIVAYQDKAILDANTFVNAVSMTSFGSPARLILIRSGQELGISVRIESFPAD